MSYGLELHCSVQYSLVHMKKMQRLLKNEIRSDEYVCSILTQATKCLPALQQKYLFPRLRCGVANTITFSN